MCVAAPACRPPAHVCHDRAGTTVLPKAEGEPWHLAVPSPLPVCCRPLRADVANRVTDKITPLTDRVYICRSGSAADTQNLSRYVQVGCLWVAGRGAQLDRSRPQPKASLLPLCKLQQQPAIVSCAPGALPCSGFWSSTAWSWGTTLR